MGDVTPCNFAILEFAMNPQTLVSELESLLEQLDLSKDSRFEIGQILRQLKRLCYQDSKANADQIE